MSRSNSSGGALSDSALVPHQLPAIVPPVKLPRIFLLLLAVLALNGCATYTKLRVTAVERESGPPYPTLSKYPDGWRTTVTGPNIMHWRCAKPLWLYDRERE